MISSSAPVTTGVGAGAEPSSALAEVRALDRSAVHEAAHAVVACGFGHPLESVRIRPTGLTTLASLDRWQPGQELYFRLAGSVAEEIAFGSGELLGSDRGWVDRIADRMTGGTLDEIDGLIEAGRTVVRKLLGEYWSDLERLAAALLTHGSLTGARVAELLDQPSPTRPKLQLVKGWTRDGRHHLPAHR